MDFKAELKDLGINYESRKLIVQLTCPLDKFDGLQKLINKNVRLRITQYRAHRSLDANAYYWVLVNKIADATQMPSTAVHNMLLADYGVVNAEMGLVWLDNKVDWMGLLIHLKPTGNSKFIDGKLMSEYVSIRGSSSYDSKEFSNLINGAVQEAKELSIDTESGERIEEMIRNYEKEHPSGN
jgi:hypothetical protein